MLTNYQNEIPIIIEFPDKTTIIHFDSNPSRVSILPLIPRTILSTKAYTNRDIDNKNEPYNGVGDPVVYEGLLPMGSRPPAP